MYGSTAHTGRNTDTGRPGALGRETRRTLDWSKRTLTVLSRRIPIRKEDAVKPAAVSDQWRSAHLAAALALRQSCVSAQDVLRLGAVVTDPGCVLHHVLSTPHCAASQAINDLSVSDIFSSSTICEQSFTTTRTWTEQFKFLVRTN